MATTATASPAVTDADVLMCRKITTLASARSACDHKPGATLTAPDTSTADDATGLRRVSVLRGLTATAPDQAFSTSSEMTASLVTRSVLIVPRYLRARCVDISTTAVVQRDPSMDMLRTSTPHGRLVECDRLKGIGDAPFNSFGNGPAAFLRPTDKVNIEAAVMSVGRG